MIFWAIIASSSVSKITLSSSCHLCLQRCFVRLGNFFILLAISYIKCCSLDAMTTSISSSSSSASYWASIIGSSSGSILFLVVIFITFMSRVTFCLKWLDLGKNTKTLCVYYSLKLPSLFIFFLFLFNLWRDSAFCSFFLRSLQIVDKQPGLRR